jgi:uncharacterized FAD-dependent dehydrogenase
MVCIEAGVEPNLRFCSILKGKACQRVEPCQMITGVGGSSLVSGGKVSDFPAGRSISAVLGGTGESRRRLREALREFEHFVPLISPRFSSKATQEEADRYGRLGFKFRYYDSYLCRRADLVAGYDRMLAEISRSGAAVRLGTHVTQVASTEQGFRVSGYSRQAEEELLARRLVLAVGRSGADLLESTRYTLGLRGEPNHCDVGIRMEFPTWVWPDIDRSHNDLKLHFGNARTFCVCKEGSLAPYRLDDVFLLEGCTDPDRPTGFTNLGISVRHRPGASGGERMLLSEVRRRLLAQSGGKPVRQLLTDFLVNRPSSPDTTGGAGPASISFWKWGSVSECLPEDLVHPIRDAVEYFASRLVSQDAYPAVSVFAPELDYFWPRFPLTSGFLSRIEGLYLIGDCSGQFRGILQAFCSGLVCAETLLEVSGV